MTGVGVDREQEVPARNRRCYVGEAVVQRQRSSAEGGRLHHKSRALFIAAPRPQKQGERAHGFEDFGPGRAPKSESSAQAIPASMKDEMELLAHSPWKPSNATEAPSAASRFASSARAYAVNDASSFTDFRAAKSVSVMSDQRAI